VGLSTRTLQRWRRPEHVEDRRKGPLRPPANRLSEVERARALEIANAQEYADLSPHQIVVRLADQGTYVASESSLYRLLREQRMTTHRQASRPPAPRPREHRAHGPGQVWSWDITYLRGPVRGDFFYLYLIEDVWSRRIVGWEVHERECAAYAAKLMAQAIHADGQRDRPRVLHSDNGSPMKGATMLATLQRLGVVPSFSRPRVHDDNPYSEALFRTLKYRPEYPRGAFDSLEAARDWVAGFVRWYNTEHRHSAIRFVTPDQRHFGRDRKVLEARRRVYQAARNRHPERWSRGIRDWNPIEEVYLNPMRDAS